MSYNRLLESHLRWMVEWTGGFHLVWSVIRSVNEVRCWWTFLSIDSILNGWAHFVWLATTISHICLGTFLTGVVVVVVLTRFMPRRRRRQQQQHEREHARIDWCSLTQRCQCEMKTIQFVWFYVCSVPVPSDRCVQCVCVCVCVSTFDDEVVSEECVLFSHSSGFWPKYLGFGSLDVSSIFPSFSMSRVPGFRN